MARHDPGSRDTRRLKPGPKIVKMVGMDPELEAFIPFFPKAELTDVVKERAILAELAAGIPAETDGM